MELEILKSRVALTSGRARAVHANHKMFCLVSINQLSTAIYSVNVLHSQFLLLYLKQISFIVVHFIYLQLQSFSQNKS